MFSPNLPRRKTSPNPRLFPEKAQSLGDDFFGFPRILRGGSGLWSETHSQGFILVLEHLEEEKLSRTSFC